MLVPGQVEKWIGIFDVRQQSLYSMPVNTFKDIVDELQNMFLEAAAKTMMINLSFFSTKIGKLA